MHAGKSPHPSPFPEGDEGLNRGIAYAAKGEYDRAIADYDKAIALDAKTIPVVDQNAAAFHHRGRAYHAKGEYNHAIFDFRIAIEIYATKLSLFGCGGWDPRPANTSNLEEQSTILQGNADACRREVEGSGRDQP